MSESKTLGVAGLSMEAASKRRRWQRVFLYPTVIGALLGAIPTGLDYYKAFVYDIDFGDVRHAEEQRRLWVKNFTCAQNIAYQQVRTSEDILVQVGACDNGDVLIEVVPPAGNRIVEWISLERLKTASAVSSLSLVAKAYAAATAQGEARIAPVARTRLAQSGNAVKCQKMHGQTKIVRVVEENGKCFREEISVMKGAVTSRRPVSCSASCD